VIVAKMTCCQGGIVCFKNRPEVLHRGRGVCDRCLGARSSLGQGLERDSAVPAAEALSGAVLDWRYGLRS
jgi:hypothetical protein